MLEKSIIGALYLSDDMRQQIIANITYNDFANPSARLAFTTMAENSKLDKIDVIHRIPNSETKTYILEAIELAPVESNVLITLNSFIEFASNRKFTEQLQTLALTGATEDKLEQILADKGQR